MREGDRGIVYIFYKNGVGFKDYWENDAKAKINNYNSALQFYNDKQSSFNSAVQEYNSLLARRSNLPNEISTLQNDLAILTDQLNDLESEVNFIQTYLSSFEGGNNSIIENVYTGDGNDIIIGNDQDNKIWAGRGENKITGGAGVDTFIIKENSTTSDTITDFKIGEDKIDLSDFASLNFSDLNISNQGKDVVITFASGQKIILKNLQSDLIMIDSFIGIAGSVNRINGTNSDDNLVGTDLSDSINGSAGNDWISSGALDDYINGGDGNDALAGGNAADIIYGGDGNDYIYGDGEIDFTTNQIVNSEIQSGDDRIYGGLGNDVIYGLAGNDYIVGDDGSNVIYGGAGNDVIYFDGVRNDVFGDEGVDNFIITERSSLTENIYDLIYDFDVTNEKIDLSAFKNIDDSFDFPVSQVGDDAYVVLKSENGFSQYAVLVGVNIYDLSSRNFIIKNDAPIANADNAVVNEDNSVVINVFANDSDDKTLISSLDKSNISVTRHHLKNCV